ncbi:MAG: ribosome silencing factor [Bacteroidia bacterium]
MAKKEIKIKKAAAPVKKVSRVKKVKPQEDIVDVIIKAMEDKKAHNIVCMDLRNVESAVTDFFIICHGTSTTQVEAIGNSVEDEVQKVLGERPFHAEGYRNGEWVLIDYFNVVAHIFIDEKRDFYRLEKLWADAEIRKVG